MSIDFPCSNCGRTLRTPESAAGRQAQCPECQAMTTVPGAASGPAPGPTPGPQSSPSPFGPAGPSRPASPFGASDSEQGPASINPYQSPSSYDEPFSASGYSGPIRPGQLVLEDVFSQTWEIFKLQWGQCLVAYLILLGITWGFNIAFGIGAVVAGQAMGDRNVIEAISRVGDILGNLLTVWLNIGMASFYLKVVRGQAVNFSEIFSGGPKFLPILGASILVGLACFGGFLLLIVPAFIFALMFSQFYYLIIDGNLGVFEALGVSKKIMAGNKLTLFLVWLVMGFGGLIVIVFTCCIGVLAVAPFGYLLNAIIYLSVTGRLAENEGDNPFRSAGESGYTP